MEPTPKGSPAKALHFHRTLGVRAGQARCEAGLDFVEPLGVGIAFGAATMFDAAKIERRGWKKQ